MMSCSAAAKRTASGQTPCLRVHLIKTAHVSFLACCQLASEYLLFQVRLSIQQNKADEKIIDIHQGG